MSVYDSVGIWFKKKIGAKCEIIDAVVFESRWLDEAERRGLELGSRSVPVAVTVVLLAQRPLEILQVLVSVGRAAPGRTSFRTPTVAIFFTGFTAASHMRAQSSAAAVALGPGSRGGITFVLFARARAVVPQTVALTY